MTVDHGHPLRFGVLLTPEADRPQAAVERARLSEELGYDVVSFRDSPGGIDPWTLLSWVAARTSRIRLLAGPVGEAVNPAVVARAAAGLDLLSDGRVELALRPAPAVAATSEALDVIRGIWAVNVRSPLRLDGRHHRLAGAERGPAPAHNIPVWLAAGTHPQALRLAAAKADGWLLTAPGPADGSPLTAPGPANGPALTWDDVRDELAAAGAVIDEAARAEGRDPREVHRLVHLAPTAPPERWAADLLP
ncbi:LLM class flavin-dependent oxidoreductase [Nonomuraea thailandensis]